MIVTVWPFRTRKSMTAYTVHEPPAPPADRIDHAEAMVFVKDGFTWSAFLFGPLWLLANRLWLAAAGYVALLGLIYLVLAALGLADALFSIMMFALNVILGFEAHWLRTTKLDADGWTSLGSIAGRGIEDSERRFFEGWLKSEPRVRSADASQPASSTGLVSMKHLMQEFLPRLRKG